MNCNRTKSTIHIKPRLAQAHADQTFITNSGHLQGSNGSNGSMPGLIYVSNGCTDQCLNFR